MSLNSKILGERFVAFHHMVECRLPLLMMLLLLLKSLVVLSHNKLRVQTLNSSSVKSTFCFNQTLRPVNCLLKL